MTRRSRTADKAARAQRAKVRGDNLMIERIERQESKKTGNKTTRDKQPETAVDAPVKENPHDRILRRLREENARQE